MIALQDGVSLVDHPLVESLLRDAGVAFIRPTYHPTFGGEGTMWVRVGREEAMAKPAAVAGVLRALMAVGLENPNLVANRTYLVALDRCAFLLGAGDGHRHS